MSICPIPGFGPYATYPSPENLAALKGMLALPVTAFASAYHYYDTGGHKQSAPDFGNPPKYWCDPNTHRASKFVFLKRNENGEYVSVKLTRDFQRFPVHLSLFSQSALSFLCEERASYGIEVPDLEIRDITYDEVGRLSFPNQEIQDPVDYPIAAVEGPLDHLITTFSRDAILFIENGKPFVCSIEDAQKKWPVQRGPRPTQPAAPVVAPVTSGYPAEAIVGIAQKMLASSTNRSKAAVILGGPSSAAAKVADLMKL